MKSTERNAFQNMVNRALCDCDDRTRRLDLFDIGESLIFEFKDLSVKEINKKITRLEKEAR